MSLVDQLPALIGVVVGAGLSFTSTSFVERSRWRRSQAVRWDERKLTAYAEFGNAVKDLVLLANRIAAGRGLNEHPRPMEPTEQNLARLAEAAAQCSLLNERLRLLADEDTITASRAMNHRAYRLEWFAYGRIEGGPEAWAAAYVAYRDARDAYLGCARASLQVEGPGVPRDRTWPPASLSDQL